MDETLIQYECDRTPADSGPSANQRRLRCAVCGQCFSGDARFCPFDGESLQSIPEQDCERDPRLGNVIDSRYELLEVLGEGGMGTVYRVRHTTLGRGFALKVLRRDLASDAELSARFIGEAKAAAAISHPNVVQITDFGAMPSGEPYFVMELLAGVPLSRLIRIGRPPPLDRAVRIVRQVAEALGAAHDAGIVHRDLKPENVQVAALGAHRDVVKVLDFGLAKVVGASRLTRQGVVFGTPHYMCPEQAAGETVDQRADIYSLGVVMYEVFTGSVPFEADSYMGVLTKHMYVVPTPPSEVAGAPELGALEAVTLRCLQKKPAQRYASMGELLADLDSIVHYTESGELEVRPARAKPAPKVRSVLADELEAVNAAPEPATAVAQRSKRWPLWAVAGLALVATGGLWFALRRSPAGQQASAPPTAAAARPARVVPVARAPSLSQPSAAPPPHPAPAPLAAPEDRPARAAARHARRPTRHLRTSASAARRKPAKVPSIGGGEIINPWAQ